MSGAVCTTCPYCGVGCGVRVTVGEAQSGQVAVSGDPDHPANLGRLCVKGSALGETLGDEGRLLYPEIEGRRASWDQALDQVAGDLRRTLTRHGPEAVAFYVSGQLLTEDYYVANKLMKGFLGSANIDTNSRLCMSSAVAAHKRVLGSDSVPGNYRDLELADLLVITGSNLAWAHPVLYQRIAAEKARRPGLRVVVIDPRQTATCELADLHLPLAPGSDGYLFDGLLAWLVRQQAVDRDFVRRHTEGFKAQAAASLTRNPDLAASAAACGLPAEKLERLYRWFAQTPRTVTLFSQGINQSTTGVDKGSAILHCHLATGRIGRPGASPFSITGQPNAMGGREVGGLANQLAAHMELDNPQHREQVARFWGASQIPARPGLRAVELFEAVARGDVKFLWVIATNPAVSLPRSARVREALAGCETLVVSDCVDDTDTLRHARIRLPAAAWGEKDGTVTNSERRISRQRAFLPPPGEARPDWWMLCQVASRLGHGGAFDYPGPAAIFREHAALSAFENGGRRDFDIGALAELSDTAYDTLRPVQWPCPATPVGRHSGAGAGSEDKAGDALDRDTGDELGEPRGSGRLFADGHFFTPSGRARFVDCRPRPLPVAVDSEFPLMLNTGRIRDQWHSMTRTGRSDRLLQHIAEPFVEMHPDDLVQCGLEDGELVEVRSALGQCRVRARAQMGQTPGTAFMPIHWSDGFASAATVDTLVAAQVDPYSGQPAFKQTPVSVTALSPCWEALLLSRERLPLPDVDYWCRRPRGGWQLVNLAARLPPGMIDWKQLWQGAVENWAELEDSAGEFLRLVGYREGRPVCWLALGAGRPSVDESWLLDALTAGELPALNLARGRPLAGGDCSALVCSCHQVREAAIQQAIDDGAQTAEALGEQTRAGTNCGSCLPELRKLLSMR
ncbi:MAG: nitrate reductase [Haliea sp.]|nr:nitrate reductase [Haliea sp.]|tara:strand:- start:42460 stop:45180 length:2721 start_codon:yes stop_codon:yes gene_type:complete